MCGIAGVICPDPPLENLPDVLRRMQACLLHRGPDDRGIYVSRDGRAGLVHTRLAILDLSPLGHQPMSSVDGRFHITFNGEIYNFRELRQELEAEGEKFHTQSDTEVLLRMYQRYGPDCVREFAGMFAFAIWDERDGTCFLARDPLGIKPLYYCARDHQLAFASELRALVDSDLTSRRLSRAAVLGYLLFGSVQEPDTMIEGVRELPAGSYLLWNHQQHRERKYYDVEFGAGTSAGAEPVAATRAALEDSVRRHFVSDVPVGIFLSGGIDSTSLVALARRVGIKDVRTFSISFDSAEFNEGEVAARTARHFATDHYDWRLGSNEGKSLLHNFLANLDEPSVDGFNTYCVSKCARDHGAKVVLSGLGGDELFGGYRSFATVPKLAEYGQWISLTGPVRLLAGRFMQTSMPRPRHRRLGAFLSSQPSVGAAYWTMRGIFTPHETDQLLKWYFQDDVSFQDQSIMHFRVPAQPTRQDMVSYLEISRYMRNQLLRDSDVMSMAWGLELRVPFVDSRLVDVLVNIPASIRLCVGKNLLLRAVPEIPAWVARRPKQGFVFPFREWIDDEWKDVFTRLDDASPVPLQTWYRRWCLFALESFIERNRIDAGRLASIESVL